ncbi:MAG: lysine--tRNA ligase, partial [Thermoprotei archaeon]
VKREPVELSDREREAVKKLIERIMASEDPEEVQGAIFQTAREHGIKPKEFFKKLYKILLGRDHGPRLGPYIWDYGKEKVVNILRRSLGQEI